ncbi:hypothetical protein HT746_00900 [Burkholderia pyrrocinia]|nr:hypothetical protein [Burkholderia pyrrocinia]
MPFVYTIQRSGNEEATNDRRLSSATIWEALIKTGPGKPDVDVNFLVSEIEVADFKGSLDFDAVCRLRLI